MTSKEWQGEPTPQSIIGEDHCQPNNDQQRIQGKPIPYSITHCLFGDIYTPSKCHMFFEASANSKSSDIPF